MIATAILTIVVIWCLFYTVIPNAILISVCLLLGASFAIVNNHRHEGHLSIDVIAQSSKLNEVSPSVKFWTVLILMFVCVGSNSPAVGLFLTVLMLILTVHVGGLELHDYLSMLLVPVLFLLVSSLALLFEYTVQPSGVINFHLFSGYLSVSHNAQQMALLVTSKAIGAISCLYLLSLSTPMSEIIDVLRKSRVPDIVIELMYLIYRYIFVLFDMYHSMKVAAKSRLGFVDYPTSVHTTGQIYTNLLARSYHKANKNFDAMESRCYMGEIRFLENNNKIPSSHIRIASFTVIVTLGMAIMLH